MASEGEQRPPGTVVPRPVWVYLWAWGFELELVEYPVSGSEKLAPLEIRPLSTRLSAPVSYRLGVQEGVLPRRGSLYRGLDPIDPESNRGSLPSSRRSSEAGMWCCVDPSDKIFDMMDGRSFQIPPESHKLEDDWKTEILFELIGELCSRRAANQSSSFGFLFLF